LPFNRRSGSGASTTFRGRAAAVAAEKKLTDLVGHHIYFKFGIRAKREVCTFIPTQQVLTTYRSINAFQEI
jgi:hypothetical protein